MKTTKMDASEEGKLLDKLRLLSSVEQRLQAAGTETQVSGTYKSLLDHVISEVKLCEDKVMSVWRRMDSETSTIERNASAPETVTHVSESMAELMTGILDLFASVKKVSIGMKIARKKRAIKVRLCEVESRGSMAAPERASDDVTHRVAACLSPDPPYYEDDVLSRRIEVALDARLAVLERLASERKACSAGAAVGTATDAAGLAPAATAPCQAPCQAPGKVNAAAGATASEPAPRAPRKKRQTSRRRARSPADESPPASAAAAASKDSGARVPAESEWTVVTRRRARRPGPCEGTPTVIRDSAVTGTYGGKPPIWDSVVKCYRCLRPGHVARVCTMKVDYGGRCFRCGRRRHKASSCVAAARCLHCVEYGYNHTNHIVWDAKCRAKRDRATVRNNVTLAEKGTTCPPASEGAV